MFPIEINLLHGYEVANSASVQVDSILVKSVAVDLFRGRECYGGGWRFKLAQITNVFVRFIFIGVCCLVRTKSAWEWLPKKYLGFRKAVAFEQERGCDGNSVFALVSLFQQNQGFF